MKPKFHLIFRNIFHRNNLITSVKKNWRIRYMKIFSVEWPMGLKKLGKRTYKVTEITHSMADKWDVKKLCTMICRQGNDFKGISPMIIIAKYKHHSTNIFASCALFRVLGVEGLIFSLACILVRLCNSLALHGVLLLLLLLLKNQ